MGAVKNLTELFTLYFDSMSKEEVSKLILSLDKSINSTFELLENLLQWAQSQRGIIQFVPEDLDMISICAECFLFSGENAEKKSIKLKNEIPQGTVVLADKNMLLTILRNLLSNAIKFSNKFGEVTVMAQKNSDSITVTVKDNGIGMSKDTMEKIFKIDSHHTTVGTMQEKGTGLGLILCKEFIEKNGGTIRAESQEGKSSSFIFTLPTSKSEQDQPISIKEILY